jgi:predicted phage replisome organizer
MEISFIKLKTNMFDDEKIKIIKRMPDGDKFLLIWIELLCLAGRLNRGGYIMITDSIPMTKEDIAATFDYPVGIVAHALSTFERFEMITVDNNMAIYISNWAKHQSVDRIERNNETSKERMRRFREKKKLQLGAGNVTCDVTCDVTGNVTVTHGYEGDTDKEDKSKKKDTEEERVTVCEPSFNLLKEYSPTDFTEEQKKERLSQMYKEMKNSTRITLHAKTYDRTETTIKEHLSNFIRERFLTDDAHHSINQYWHYFNLYLKKINL